MVKKNVEKSYRAWYDFSTVTNVNLLSSSILVTITKYRHVPNVTFGSASEYPLWHVQWSECLEIWENFGITSEYYYYKHISFSKSLYQVFNVLKCKWQLRVVAMSYSHSHSPQHRCIHYTHMLIILWTGEGCSTEGNSLTIYLYIYIFHCK